MSRGLVLAEEAKLRRQLFSRMVRGHWTGAQVRRNQLVLLMSLSSFSFSFGVKSRGRTGYEGDDDGLKKRIKHRSLVLG